MKLDALTVLVALLSTTGAIADDNSPIHVDELNRRPVIGRLGVPLGKPVVIQAKIIDGSGIDRKSYDETYLLEVSHVDGVQLDNPVLMEFYTPGYVRVKLPHNAFGLYEQVYGKAASKLDSAQTADLEKEYVGRTVLVVAYETGSFHGLPSDLPNDVPIPQSTSFHFSTSLVVVADRSRRKGQ